LIAFLTAGTLLLQIVTPMPPPASERGIRASELGDLLGRPILYLLAVLLFLYVACEAGFSTWLARHFVAQGMSEKDALNTLTAFAFGILTGRALVSRILIRAPALTVTFTAAVLMAVFTYVALRTTGPAAAPIVVFCAGLAMAPVFPTTLAIVGDAFPK